MATLGNIIWFVFCGGFLLGLGWCFAGLLLAVTVIGIPFAVICFRIASFAFFPFGKELVTAESIGETPVVGSTIMNILWFLLAGVWLAIGHLFAACACLASCFAILPFFLGAPAWALAHWRLAKVSLAPLGMRIVSVETARRVSRQ